MKRRFRRAMGKDPVADPRVSVEPLVDIAFLMLIFFLVSTTILKRETDLGLRIPDEGQAAAPVAAATVVEVRENGWVILNPGEREIVVSHDPAERQLPRLEQHLRMLKAGGEELSVMLRADEDAVYQRVTDVLDCMKKVGVARLSFVDEGA